MHLGNKNAFGLHKLMLLHPRRAQVYMSAGSTTLAIKLTSKKKKSSVEKEHEENDGTLKYVPALMLYLVEG